MARGRRSRLQRYGQPCVPTALQDGQTHHAERKIDRLEEQQIELMVPRSFEFENIMACLFSQDMLAKSRAMQPHLFTHYHSVSYSRVKVGKTVINLNVDYEDAPYCPIKEQSVKVSNPAIIEEWVAKATVIRTKWDQVRRVFKFLNENGTVGHMRHYWPAVLALLPPHESNTPIHQADGTRFRDRPNMGLWLTAIRESAATVTSSLLMPEKSGETRPHFTRISFEYAGEKVGAPYPSPISEMEFSATYNFV